MPPRSEPSAPIDLNILPQRYRPKVVPPALVLVWGVAVLLLLLVGPMLYIAHVSGKRAADADVALKTAQVELQSLRTPAPAVETLAAELRQAREDLAILQTIEPTAVGPYYDWEAISDALLAHDRARIRLTEMSQDRGNLIVRGLAVAREDVLAYAEWLESSGVFDQVLVQSMRDASVTFHPTPTITMLPDLPYTPTVALPATVTPAPYDAYEIDDFEPKLIIPGEIQWRNFNPTHDVDRAVFTGRAGRRYCILALPQALGVDTVLEVTVGAQTYRSFDCRDEASARMACHCPSETVTGTKASLVEVQIDRHTDQVVQIKVTNRGLYGPDMWYTLQVQGTIGDPWEPDDLNPVPIAVGEAQQRSFFPDGDVDRVTFPVKAGRVYELRTTDLAVGVDTVLTVHVGGVTHRSEDVRPGERSSRVEFVAVADGVAQATVTNKGLYGPEMTYTLELREGIGDAYEPDDYAPVPISVFERQRRTFYPEGDIDRMELQVKAGRIYEVRTYDLAVGVDTVLTVLVDGMVHKNDDIAPGDLSSRVVFKAARDGVAAITVTNRDQYGPDKEYWVTVRELAGTPTPDYTLTPDLRTPTPDCGDPYEPDDIVPRFIAVGGEQRRTFCPEGDIDRAVFTAKAGYAYQIETTDLALGVDTFLKVQMGDVVHSNDDRAPQDLSSMVQIQNHTDADLPVFITVTNKGLFGPDMTYTLRVSDIAPGDPYEPDLEIKRYIAVGEVQRHTFHPEFDVDRVWLRVKAGRSYVLYTCGNPYQPKAGQTPIPVPTLTPVGDTLDACMPLVPGVDTVLVATGPITNCDPVTCLSDDAYPGTGMLNSRVAFQAVADGEVSITIYNKGSFGPDMYYYIICEEVGGTLTATPTAEASGAPLRRVGLAAPLQQLPLPIVGNAQEGAAIEFTLMLRLRSVMP